MHVNFDEFERSFDRAQAVFGGEIDTTDRSKLVATGDPQSSLDFLRDDRPDERDFHPLSIDSDLLVRESRLFVGRAILMHNPKFNANSPVIITEDPDNQGRFLLTMFDQPYDPEVGFSVGMHWGISTIAQARARGFGEHGDQASGLEQGHLGAAIVGVYDANVGNAIVEGGDHGAHETVLDEGVPEKMGQEGILPSAAKTIYLPEHLPRPLRAYWHHRLQDDGGPISGDFPEATRLMIAGGLHAIGENGIPRLETLVKDAVRGAA